MAMIIPQRFPIINLKWEPPEEMRMGRQSPRLIAILHPTGLVFNHGDGTVDFIDITVAHVPEWMKPDEPKKPLSPVAMLKKNLAQEPWLSMQAMCDAMEESGDPLALGWRMIADSKVVPISNTYRESSLHTHLEWREEMVGRVTWQHHVISEPRVNYIQTPGTQLHPPKQSRKFSTVMMAWEALATAWSQTGGK